MPEPVSIYVCEVVGNDLCVASDDGQKVYDQIASAFRKEKKVPPSAPSSF